MSMPSKPTRALLLAVLLALLTALSLPPAAEAQPDRGSFTVTDVMVPVSDSTRLHGRLYRPASDSARPTIFSMTPYTVDDAHEYGRYFASRGYVYLNVDVRGRGASDGTFRPLVGTDGADGAAVARWVAQQPWGDGRVAMRGHSYRGIVQWQILAEGAEPLRSAVPTAANYPGYDFPSHHGIFYSYAARWLSLVRERAHQGALFGDTGYWSGKYRALHTSGRPFQDLADMAGLSLRSAAIFKEWTRHPHLDDYWQAPSPDPADYRGLDPPILTVTGHFDGAQPGALHYYRKHMQHGAAQGPQQHYLLMGPWGHFGTRTPTKEHRGLTFADTAAIDMKRLHLKWYDWVLKEGTKPEMLSGRVVYYVMGADRWRAAPSLEAVADTSRTFYLQSHDSNPDDPFDAGQLLAQSPEEPDTDQYVYNSRDTADFKTLQSMQRSLTAPGAAFLDGPKLIYHSAPVEASFELAGQMRLDAWIELDVPDTDLAAWVYEIRPTGRTIHLGWTKLRARHRMGVDTTRLVEPGSVQRYRFDRFYWTSRRIQEGSRIRLVIAPLNDPAWQKNYNAAKPPVQQSVEDARTATVKLHLGPDRPSKLVLPVRSGGGR
jgi:putative CocE/NonD family hydrolase